MTNEIEIRDRIKIIRENLGLSQAEFGEKISLERSAISLIERKQRNATDRFIKDICREFGVDYIWLTTGEGEMFVDSDDDFIEKIDRIMAGEDDARKNIFKFMLSLNDDDIAALNRLMSQAIEYVEKLRSKDSNKKD